MAPTLPPATAGERLEMLDIIRGFALCGIFLGNLLWFSGLQELPLRDRGGLLGNGADEAVLFLLRLLVNAKFYHLFAFLFGLGFALQLQKSGGAVTAAFLRRMGWLLAFGLAHSLLWWGDILRYYALIGLALVCFRHLANHQLLWVIAACSLLPLASEPVKAWLQIDYRSLSFVGIAPRDWQAHLLQASVGEMFRLNFLRIADQFVEAVVDGRIFRILAMFLAGMLAGRLGVFSRPREHARAIRGVILPSLCIGIAGNLAITSLFYQRWGLDRSTVALLRDCIGLVATPALSLFYASALLHLWIHPQRWPRLLGAFRLLAPAGRMALTIYLMQTLIAVAIFWPPLGGQYARLGIAPGALLMLLVFGAQVWLSHIWLRRYHFGPLEWLWRSGTRLQWQRLRR